MSFSRPALPALLAAAAITLSGCTSSTDSPQEPAAGQSPAATTSAPETSTTPATPAGTTPPTVASSRTPTPGTSQLLATAQVPGLNARWHWHDGRTSSGDTDPFGVCAKADLGSIGATGLLERTYFPPDDSDDNAGEQIGAFVDVRNASLAWSVLDSWRSKCPATLGTKTGAKVTPATAVPLSSGDPARWYLVSWTPAGEETGRFEAIGMIRHGSTIVVLRMTSSGQDHDYPPGKDPMVTMVRRAADALG